MEWYFADGNGPYNTRQDAINAAQEFLDGVVERGDVIHDNFEIYEEDALGNILQTGIVELTASDVEGLRVHYSEEQGEVFYG